MSKSKFLLTLAAFSLMIAGTSGIKAQSTKEGLSLGPSARPFDATETAFVDTDYYEYDAQLWAPWDVTTMDGSRRWATGFYAELGFAYLSLTLPEAIPGQDPRNFNTGTQYYWANDLEVGWYSTKDDGWAAHWLDLEGMVFVNGSNILINQPMMLRTQINDVELNRQFRQRLSNGGWVEPFIGARFISFDDTTIQDGQFTAVSSIRFEQQVKNNAMGGHVGTRYFREYNRFRWGGDLALGALYNNQTYFSNTILINTVTGAIADSEITNSDSEVLPVLDLGVELSLWLTRDISLRGGAQFSYLWSGVARADIRTTAINPQAVVSGLPTPASVHSEDVIAAGFSFGIDWKR